MTQAATSEQAGPTRSEAVDQREVLRILAQHVDNRGGLIAALEQIQIRHGYLPLDALRIVSEQTGRPLVDVYGIATFYRAFSLVPRGRHLVCACLGTACHVRGAPTVVEELERQLGIRAGQTTPDGEFTFETVNCLGACALGPVVVIDGRYFSKVRKSRIRQLLDDAATGTGQAGAGQEQGTFPIVASCPRCNHSLMDGGFLINELPTIRCRITFDRRHGWLRLSSLQGSPATACEPEILPGAVMNFFCPFCHSQLAGGSACSLCEAPMVPLMLGGGGVVRVCSRRGCASREVELT